MFSPLSQVTWTAKVKSAFVPLGQRLAESFSITAAKQVLMSASPGTKALIVLLAVLGTSHAGYHFVLEEQHLFSLECRKAARFFEAWEWEFVARNRSTRGDYDEAVLQAWASIPDFEHLDHMFAPTEDRDCAKRLRTLLRRLLEGFKGQQQFSNDATEDELLWSTKAGLAFFQSHYAILKLMGGEEGAAQELADKSTATWRSLLAELRSATGGQHNTHSELFKELLLCAEHNASDDEGTSLFEKLRKKHYMADGSIFQMMLKVGDSQPGGTGSKILPPTIV